MTTILANNPRASLLAHSLWEFYKFELYCDVLQDDGQPNRHRIKGIDGPNTFGTVHVLLSIRQNERQEPGLVHELLHANLIPMGYPKFWIYNDDDSDLWRLAEGITNNAEHQAMLPMFSSLGYRRDQFLGASKLTTDREKHTIADIEKMATDLITPNGYFHRVSSYLSSHGIKFETLYLADVTYKRESNP